MRGRVRVLVVRGRGREMRVLGEVGDAELIRAALADALREQEALCEALEQRGRITGAVEPARRMKAPKPAPRVLH